MPRQTQSRQVLAVRTRCVPASWFDRLGRVNTISIKLE